MAFESYDPSDRPGLMESMKAVRIGDQGYIIFPEGLCEEAGIGEGKHWARLMYDADTRTVGIEWGKGEKPSKKELVLNVGRYWQKKYARVSGSGMYGRFGIEVVPGCYQTQIERAGEEGGFVTFSFEKPIRRAKRMRRGQRSVTVSEARKVRAIRKQLEKLSEDKGFTPPTEKEYRSMKGQEECQEN